MGDEDAKAGPPEKPAGQAKGKEASDGAGRPSPSGSGRVPTLDEIEAWARAPSQPDAPASGEARPPPPSTPDAPAPGVVKPRPGSDPEAPAAGVTKPRPPSDPEAPAAGVTRPRTPSAPEAPAAGKAASPPPSEPEAPALTGPPPGAGEITRDIAALAKQLHRGPASPGERLAADHLARELKKMGIEPVFEDFRAPKSDSLEHLVFSALLVIGGVLVGLVPVAALLVGLLSAALFVAFLLELPTPLRRILPAGVSRNVVGTIRPQKERRRRVVISAHYDAAQALLRARITGAFLADRILFLLVALGTVGIGGWAMVTEGGFYPTLAGFGVAGFGLLRLLLMLHGLGSKVVPGANDNASGTAAVLLAARRLVADRPVDTEVTILFTGSKESGCHGIRHHVRQEGQTSPGRYVIVEAVGAGRLHLVTGEGALFPTHYSGSLPETGRRMLAFRQHRALREGRFRRGFLDARVPAKAGRSVVALVGLDGRGRIPQRYRVTDTPDKISATVACQAAEFAEGLVRELERRGT